MRLLLCLLLQLRTGHAADASKAHMNSGINPPFASAKPQVTLTGSEETALAAGRAVMRQVTSKDGKGGRALAVQDVAASPDTVWNRILAFPEYPKMVTGVQAQPLPHASRLTRHAAPSRLTSRASRLSPCTRSAADHPRWHLLAGVQQLRDDHTPEWHANHPDAHEAGRDGCEPRVLHRPHVRAEARRPHVDARLRATERPHRLGRALATHSASAPPSPSPSPDPYPYPYPYPSRNPSP